MLAVVLAWRSGSLSALPVLLVFGSLITLSALTQGISLPRSPSVHERFTRDSNPCGDIQDCSAAHAQCFMGMCMCTSDFTGPGCHERLIKPGTFKQRDCLRCKMTLPDMYPNWIGAVVVVAAVNSDGTTALSSCEDVSPDWRDRGTYGKGVFLIRLAFRSPMPYVLCSIATTNICAQSTFFYRF